MDKRAAEVIAEGDLGAIIDFTIELNRKKALLDKDLEELKAHLRDVASQRRKGSYEVELDEGLSGTITVTFPGLTVKTKKGKDLRDVKVSLPSDVFAELFHHSVVVVPAMPADDMLEGIARQTLAHQRTVGHFLEFSEQTPKVFVPR